MQVGDASDRNLPHTLGGVSPAPSAVYKSSTPRVQMIPTLVTSELVLQDRNSKRPTGTPTKNCVARPARRFKKTNCYLNCCTS